MKQWITKLYRFITDRKNRPGILVILCLLLFGSLGFYESNYIEKNGIYTIGVITNVVHAPRGGYVGTFEYQYKGITYKEKATFPETKVNLSSLGKRLYVVFLPNRPQSRVALDDVPDCIGDAPPERWTKIPKCE